MDNFTIVWRLHMSLFPAPWQAPDEAHSARRGTSRSTPPLSILYPSYIFPVLLRHWLPIWKVRRSSPWAAGRGWPAQPGALPLKTPKARSRFHARTSQALKICEVWRSLLERTTVLFCDFHDPLSPRRQLPRPSKRDSAPKQQRRARLTWIQPCNQFATFQLTELRGFRNELIMICGCL